MARAFVRRLPTAFFPTLLCAGLGILFQAPASAQKPVRVIDCSAPAALPAVLHVMRGDVLLFTGDVSDTGVSTTFTLRSRTSHVSSVPFLGVHSWQFAWDSAAAKSGPYLLAYSREDGREHRLAEFDLVLLDQAPFSLTVTRTPGAASLTAQVAPAGPSLLRAVSYDLAVDGRAVGTGLDPSKPGSVDLSSQEPGDHVLQAVVRAPEGGAFPTNAVPFSVAASVELLGIDKTVTVDMSGPAKSAAPLPFRYKADAGIRAQTVLLVVDGQNFARYDLPTRSPMQLDPNRLMGGTHSVRLTVIADDGERFESLPVSLQVLAPVNYRKIDDATSMGVQVHPFVELATRLANADAGELDKIKAGDDAVAAILRPVPPPASPLEAWWDTLCRPQAATPSGATAAGVWARFRASLRADPLPQDLSESDQDTLRQVVVGLDAQAVAALKPGRRGHPAPPEQALADARSQRDAAISALHDNRPVLDVLKKYGARDVPAARFAHQVTLSSFESTQRIGRTTLSQFDSLAYWQWASANPQVFIGGSHDPAAADAKSRVVKFAAAQAAIIRERNALLAAEAEALPLLLQVPVSDKAAGLCRDVADAATRGEAALTTVAAQDGATEGNQRRLTFNARQGTQWFETHAALMKSALAGALTVTSLGNSPAYADPRTVEKSNDLLRAFSSLVIAPDATSEPLAAGDGQSLGIRGLRQSLVALANVWGLRITLQEDDLPRSPSDRAAPTAAPSPTGPATMPPMTAPADTAPAD